eukprot:366253-Chlamydomonas_euryale.AAC.7
MLGTFRTVGGSSCTSARGRCMHPRTILLRAQSPDAARTKPCRCTCITMPLHMHNHAAAHA